MNKEKIVKALKIFFIGLLLMAISLLVIMQWKSDMIIDKVMSSVQAQLVDSLSYTDASLDWFMHFPSTSIHISDLRLGSGPAPLILGGDIDIVMRLFSLWNDQIIINRLQLNNSTINITQHDGRWSYDLFKKSDTPSDTSYQTHLQALVLENTTLKYADGKTLAFTLAITTAKIKGLYADNILDTEIQLNGLLSELIMDDYTQAEPFPIVLDGLYKYDMNSGLQEFKEWNLQHEGIEVKGGGTIVRQSDHEVIDMEVAWKKGRLEILKKWLPAKMMKTWNQYTLAGESEGKVKIEGRSSKHDTPYITCIASLKNGGIDFKTGAEDIKSLSLDLAYESGNDKTKEKSSLSIGFNKSSMFGSSLEGNIIIKNLQQPTIDATLKGALPADLINLMALPSLHFDQGTITVEHFELNNFQPGTSSFASFLRNGKTSFAIKDVYFTYINTKMVIPAGTLQLDAGKLTIDFDQFTWNKATTSALKGVFESKENRVDFSIEGILCEGKIESKGTLSDLEQRPTYSAQWKIVGIEMQQLLESFSNFDQTFITSDHLKGKANIWATTTIPFDEKWNILTKQILLRGAIDIRDGQLKGMKTLEDFSKYVHLDDLQDIRFNQLRNYMKIENGIVNLPVMFIQSNAINLSIRGEHSFDQNILYDIKLNAGQTAANKVKKNDVKKELKQARKSGWINMYFVLSGTTSAVKYQQNRASVISGFEQSTALKESLRNYLVETFGYDVYWLEPNEWEDIPEYE